MNTRMSTEMGTVALVPLNAAGMAKSRLRGVLGEADRVALVHWLAARVLAAIADSGVVGRIAVVSPDADLLAWAAARGATPLRQQSGGLNDGLELGRGWAAAAGAERLLVVLGDLPLLRAAEVRALLRRAPARAGAPPRVALAPDRHERGTNALVLRPVAALPFAFGPNSLARHRALAAARGIAPRLFRAPGTRFDVDTPEDVRTLRERGLWQPSTLAFTLDESGGGRHDASA